MSITTRLIVAAALLSLPVVSAVAQQPQTMRLRGTIEKLDGNVLSVKTKDGSHAVALTDNVQIVGVVKASLADIKEGVFLGSAAMPQPDGSQKALEVHIFPESMRGSGEGHRPYAPVAGSTMTNGTVNGATVTAMDGHTMTVKYRDGDKKIVIPPDVPIVAYVVGDKSDLKAGAAFTILAATKKPDGSLETARVNVGRDGAVPQ
jgi:hypothetical protein